MKRQQGGAQLGMQRNRAAAVASLGGLVVEVERIADPPLGVGHHPPLEAGDFLCAKPSADAQQHHHPVAQRVTAAVACRQCRADLGVGQNPRLLALAHRGPVRVCFCNRDAF